MASITALNVRLGMDASNFSKGADLARSEVNKVSSIMRQSEPPAEKFRKEMELLDRTFSKAGKQSKEYASAVDFLRQKHGQASTQTQQTKRDLEFLAKAEKQAADDNRFLAQTIEASTPALKKYERDIERLNALWPKSKRGTTEYANAVDHLRRKHGQAMPGINGTKAGIDQMKMSFLQAVPGGHMLAGALKGPAGAALALAAAMAVLARGVSQAAQRIDETAKAARAMGFEFGDLIAIQKQAGEVAGMDSGTVNKALERFSRSIAEARVDGGKLADSMRALNLDVDTLATKEPGEAFRDVADAIASIQDRAEQVRIATQLLGRDGVKLIEVFRGGAAALEQQRKEAERLGLVLSDEAISSIETMNDSFGRAGMAVDGIFNSITAALAPALTSIAKLAEQFFVTVSDLSGGIGGLSDAATPVLFIIEKMADGFRFILAATSDIAATLRGDFSLSETTRVMEELEAKANGVATAAEAASAHAEALAIEMQRAADEAKNVAESFDKQVEALEIERIKLEGNVELARRMELAAEGYNEEQQNQLIALEKQNAAIKERIDAEAAAADAAKKASDDATKAADKASQDRQKQSEKNIENRKREAEQAAKAFEIEVAQAKAAAEAYFAAEKAKDEQRRKDASAGPGAGMDLGSSQAVKFMADQVNERIGAASVPEKPTPGEKEIADKAQELLIAQRQANTQQAQELDTMKLLLAEFRTNKFTRLR